MVFSLVSAQCCSWVSQAGFSSVLIHCRLVLHPLGWALLFSLVFFTGACWLGWAGFSSDCLTAILHRDCRGSVQSAPPCSVWHCSAWLARLLFCSTWLCSAWSSSQGPSAWAGQCSARFASLPFFTGTARVVSSLLPSGSMWHCSVWSSSLHFCSAWQSVGVVVVCPTWFLVNIWALLRFRTGLDTYLPTAHCLVWGCLVFWVLLELELVMSWCSARPLLNAAPWSVRQGSARSLCTSGWSCIIWVGHCWSAWSSSVLFSVWGGHCSAWSSASILHWCLAWYSEGVVFTCLSVNTRSILLFTTGLVTYLATAHFIVWDCLVFGVLLELELGLS
jgi:hypothetical protein